MNDYIPEHRADEDPVIGDPPPKDNVLLSNSAYDKLVAASLYLLPALAAAYFGLAQIWGFPKAEEVLGTVAVLETLLGALLKISNTQYKNSDARFDGAIVVTPEQDEDGHPVTDLKISLSPESVSTKDEIVVKVDRK